MILSTDLSKHFGMLGAFRTAEMDVSDLANENEG